ncbi:hypothetical protein [Bdellovibrio sp. HCB274]|uniref:hypothetical protein n=1 Tax=Bdellovibrio sp. HCB274 TaxID=3394361 RepID=UPI0039B3DE5A
MKNLILALLLILPLHVFAGGDDSFGTRNGGNGQAAEFYDMGIEMVERLNLREVIQLSTGQTVFTQSLVDLFQKTKLVVSDKPLSLNGSLVDAINYPDINRIDLDGASWSNKPRSQKYRLVMHEILGLARIPDPQYKISNELVHTASVGIDWDMGYRPNCLETRNVSPALSAELLGTILGNENRSTIKNNIAISAFECRTGINLQGFDYHLCVLKPKPAENTAKKVIDVLDKIGIAKYTRIASTALVYEVQSVSCSPNVRTRAPQCQIEAYWNRDCLAKK